MVAVQAVLVEGEAEAQADDTARALRQELGLAPVDLGEILEGEERKKNKVNEADAELIEEDPDVELTNW